MIIEIHEYNIETRRTGQMCHLQHQPTSDIAGSASEAGRLHWGWAPYWLSLSKLRLPACFAAFKGQIACMVAVPAGNGMQIQHTTDLVS